MSLHVETPRKYYAPIRVRKPYYALGSAIIALCAAEAAFIRRFNSEERLTLLVQARRGVYRRPCAKFTKMVALQEIWRVNAAIATFERCKRGHRHNYRPVTIADTLGTSRRGPALVVRWLIMARLRGYGYSLPGIGWVLGKDHTSVMSGLRHLRAIQSIAAFCRGLA